MKRFTLTLLTLFLCASVYGQTEAPNGGKIPGKGTEIGGIGADGKFHFLLMDNTGAIAISASALPSGAATSAKQDTGNTSLATIATNTTSVATSTKQSDGTQKTQVVNAAGTEIFTGTLVNSTAYEASHVLKASAGQLVSVAGYNSKTSAQFIQLYNSTTVPADTAVPVLVFTVPASSNFSYDVPVTGLPFSTGIAVANSSTGPTKTVGSADCYFTAVVR
jgi:hypothetical protein